ncbi:uncharacterized protein K02A2.6-like [Saccostrea cucullata]|uniref:uncharacterized protein K02A2.6-like n=1 Tax=Saccostrea cuccullata TaxID=36930 RepID=UPI002ED5C02A
MGMPLLNYLKKNHINYVSSKVEKKLYAYGSQKPLKVAGIFTATVKYNQTVIPDVEFAVIEGEGQALLGRDTAVQLGMLQIVSSVSEAVNLDNRTVFEKYPNGFKGVGKLKSFQLEIPINPDVEPVIQPMRRIPYSLRDKLDRKLDELLDLDIIERVDKPCAWVSPVVCVPKHSGDDIRLCVDMRQANTSPSPYSSIDEILHEMNGSTVFSKLDVTWAYHQIELKPESREITTFVTHKGLFRYKRLMFGISCAPEMYQKVMQQVLQGCERVRNIMDDIFVHASSQEKHDRCLENVVRVLYEKGLTFNRDKCELTMSEVVFMGHVLSGLGIPPFEAKVKAVVEARESKTSKLKRRLADAKTLGYYDKSAPTKVIADASPVGLGAVLVQEQNVRYIPGPRNIADTLLRLVKNDPAQQSLDLEDAYVRFVAKEATPMAMTTREIERASENDAELCAIRDCLVSQQWHRIEFKQYLPVRTELCSIVRDRDAERKEKGKMYSDKRRMAAKTDIRAGDQVL